MCVFFTMVDRLKVLCEGIRERLEAERELVLFIERIPPERCERDLSRHQGTHCSVDTERLRTHLRMPDELRRMLRGRCPNLLVGWGGRGGGCVINEDKMGRDEWEKMARLGVGIKL